MLRHPQRTGRCERVFDHVLELARCGVKEEHLTPVLCEEDIGLFEDFHLVEVSVRLQWQELVHRDHLQAMSRGDDLSRLARGGEVGADRGGQQDEDALVKRARRHVRIVPVVTGIRPGHALHLHLARAGRTHLAVREVLGGVEVPATFAGTVGVVVGVAVAHRDAVVVVAVALATVHLLAGVGVVVCVVAAGDNGDQDQCGAKRQQVPSHGISLSCCLVVCLGGTELTQNCGFTRAYCFRKTFKKFFGLFKQVFSLYRKFAWLRIF